MKQRINILQVSNSRVFGGNEEHIRALIKYLDKEKFSVLTAVPENSEFGAVLKNEGFEIAYNEITSKFSFRSLKNITRIIRENNIHIIHTHNRREDLLGAVASLIQGIPHIVTIHDRINMNQEGERVNNFNARFYKFVLKHISGKIIAVSDATKKDLLQEIKITGRKVIHIINGTDFERLNVDIDTHKEREKLVGIIARVRNREIGKKGHLYFLQACKIVLEEHKNIAFLICGEDNITREYLESICRKLNIHKHVRFLGYRKDIANVIFMCDIIVQPSLFEGLPRVLVEAMYLGKPVVGTDVDGIREIIEHGKTGLLIPSKDAESLAKAVIQLLDNEGLANELGRNASKFIKSNYDARIMAQQTELLYQKLLVA
ncbi:MAG: glycosyltransferase family 4 protein [bacterium]|nr:glycosyltransferase family 4 protein [bacterium]